MLKLGKEHVVEALGQKWTFGRLSLAVIRAFRDWIEQQLPDPMAMGEKFFNLLPPDEQLARVKAAESTKQQLKCFTLKSDLAKEYMGTEQGAAKLVQLLLQKHHPDVSEDDAFLILQDIGPQLAEILSGARGEAPGLGPVQGNLPASA
jgi:hypothetical protein